MNNSLKMPDIQTEILASMCGRRLVSALSLLDCGDSALEYVLRFEDEEIVLSFSEPTDEIPWLEESCRVEVSRRPSGARDGNLLYERPVGEEVRGVSRILTKVAYSGPLSASVETAEYDRGVIIHFGEKDFVIDRGEESWSEFWRAAWTEKGKCEFGDAPPDPEYPEYFLTSRVEAISPKANFKTPSAD